MNLVIDSGNSSCKIGLFERNEFYSAENTSSEKLGGIVRKLFREKPSIRYCILAETRDLPPPIVQFLQERTYFIRLNHRTKIPFKNLYESPDTLGVDRMALAAAAQFFYPRKNCLIIDAGTCVTYDLLTEGKFYCGGAISPGLRMRYRAMAEFTAKLPSLKPLENSIPGIIGRTSEENMHSGAFWGLVFEIRAYIQHLQTQYPNLNVVLTGGDKKLLVNRLKNSIFAPPNFLMHGLNQILEFNRLND